MKANRTPIHGWLVLDKPLGPSSAQLVGKVKYLLKPQKIGHGGTLDPLATGVLPLALGEATKTMPYILDADKSYDFSITFGTQTTSDDSAGEVGATSQNRPTEAALRAILPQFTGPISQQPPAVSALKIDGERAYKLVREGKTPEMKFRPVTIHSLQLIEYDGQIAKLTASVSKGTYIRSLGRDIALALQTVGHISALRRTRHGPFTLEHAITLELERSGDRRPEGRQILDNHLWLGQKPAILPLEHALAGLPAYSVTAEQAAKLQRGIAIQLEAANGLALVSEEGTAIAMVEITAGTAQPRRVFNLPPLRDSKE